MNTVNIIITVTLLVLAVFLNQALKDNGSSGERNASTLFSIHPR